MITLGLDSIVMIAEPSKRYPSQIQGDSMCDVRLSVELHWHTLYASMGAILHVELDNLY